MESAVTNDVLQRLLTSEDTEDRDGALQELEEGLTGDYSGIFESLSGFPS